MPQLNPSMTFHNPKKKSKVVNVVLKILYNFDSFFPF